jgi:hypothetical protein
MLDHIRARKMRRFKGKFEDSDISASSLQPNPLTLLKSMEGQIVEVVRSIEVVVKELAEICSVDSHSYSQDQNFESLRAELAQERSLREVSYGNTSSSVLYFLHFFSRFSFHY